MVCFSLSHSYISCMTQQINALNLILLIPFIVLLDKFRQFFRGNYWLEYGVIHLYTSNCDKIYIKYCTANIIIFLIEPIVLTLLI